MTNPEFVTLTVGTARIEIPAADVVQQFLSNLSTGVAAPVQAPAVHVRRHRPCIGHHWDEQGGIYAGLMRSVTGTGYSLIVAAGDDGEIEDIEWGAHSESEPGATGEWDGLVNTIALVRSEHSHPAAEWAHGLKLGGHQDWYLPALRESALCYANVPELFAKEWHWTSTQYSAGSAWVQLFNNGGQGTNPKSTELRARAVRRVFDHSAI